MERFCLSGWSIVLRTWVILIFFIVSLSILTLIFGYKTKKIAVFSEELATILS
jgi:hypothetical protein